MPAEHSAFDFSFIVPIYNMEQYLEECIDSIIEQTYGFERIQLILVNDGSKDSSAEICKKYQRQYPDNIVFVDKENGGVSSARNQGLRKATGKYINFLDADDKWDESACACAMEFFETHPGIKMVSARHRFFGRISGNHALSFKFKTDTVIDIRETYDYPQLSFSNMFVSRDLLNGVSFNENLEVAEDFVLVNEILMEEHKLGIMSKPSYLYRKRDSQDSAIDTSRTKKSWYLATPKHCNQALFALSEKKYGYVIPYIQYCVMYDLQWRLRSPFAATGLNPEEFDEYRLLLLDLLSRIDDQIIMLQRNLNKEQQLSILALKKGLTTPQLRDTLRLVNGVACLADPQDNGRLEYFEKIPEKYPINLLFLTPHEKTVSIEGDFSTVLPIKATTVRVKTEHGAFEADLSRREDLAKDSFFENGYSAPYTFKVDIPYSKAIKFELLLNGHLMKSYLKAGKFFPMPKATRAYASVGEYILTWGKGMRSLSFRKRDGLWRKKRELLYERDLWKKDKKYRSMLSLRRKTIAARKSNREVWLISDRIALAGDNGEALFTYLQKNPVEGVDTYFVIGKDSPDYDRISKIGSVIEYGSKQHLRLHLQASRIISSAGEDCVFNPFGPSRYAVRDLERFKFVFLQHGITKDDISSWLKRWNKNISLFVTASPYEARSIYNNPRYGYDSATVLQSGFPRHDKLLAAATSQTRKKLMIAPTWRQHLTGAFDTKSGTREKLEGFRDSSYFKFYSSLINDSRIKEELNRHGFTMEFLLHPSMLQEADEFESEFCTISTKCDYAHEFTSSSIWVTDYSSTAFDFALLKKPILYIQNDREEFFENHTYKQGYFDYERDGFGPVVYDYETTVSAILDAIRNPVMGDEYKKRVDDFFVTPDKPRCQIVTEAIKNL